MVGNMGEAQIMKHKHMVVGDGITAAAFVEYCTLQPGDELLVLAQHADQLGRGCAYAADTKEVPWRYAYLLNSPADDIDSEFAEWLERNWDNVHERMVGRSPNWVEAAKPLVARGDTYGLNAPRSFYGDFMGEKVDAMLENLRGRGVSVKLVNGCATAIERSENHLIVSTQAGQQYVVNSVDVATGGPSIQQVDGYEGPFSSPSLFGNEDIIAEHIKAGREIFCIGSNATMLDALRLCQSLIGEDVLNFIACSPRGQLPPPLVPRMPRRLTNPVLTEGHKTAASFLDEVRHTMEAARADGDEAREMRAGFRKYFLEKGLSRFVPDMEEAKLVPGTLRHWLRGGTRDTIVDFHRLMALGKTRTMAGAVVGVEHESDGALVHMRTQDGTMKTHKTGFVINCSGAGPNSVFDPLTEHMLAAGWLQRCSVTGGLQVGENCMTGLHNTRHLSPATTIIGNEVMPMPLYDAHLLRTWAKRACGVEAMAA